MCDDYIEKLAKCAHPEEVWNLMESKEYPNSKNSLFNDVHIHIRKTSVKFQSITPLQGQLGLAYRTVLFLILDGEMSQAPNNGGCAHKADRLERTIREINDLCKINKPSDINSWLLDEYIRSQRVKGLSERSIYQKLYVLLQWQQNKHLLPHFLRLQHDLFESSLEWFDLVENSKKEQKEYEQGLGGSKEPYPLDKLSVIVTEAIDYIETYASDCIIAAEIYKEAQVRNMPTTSTAHYITKVFRATQHKFKEPQLERTQQYALSLSKNSWTANPKVTGPIQVCLDATHQLQASCVIVILMLTAMRKGELEVIPRYPKSNKTVHNELDGTLELQRLIYKTSQKQKGEIHTIAVPPIVIRALFLVSKISEISDGKKEGIINLMTLNYGCSENSLDRIRYLVISFCTKLDIEPPTPHQFRHAMAFLVAFINDDIGIELAMTLLGHKSTEMTKKYMGHYKKLLLNTFDTMLNENEQIQEAISKFQIEQSSIGLEKIIEAVEKEEPMSGPVVKRLLQGFEFAGSITNEDKVFFAKSQRLLLERGMLAVVEHPTHFCVRDLTKSEQMPCQIGISLEDFTNVPVVSAQCQTSCGCRLYTEPQVEYMKELANEMEEVYPDDLVELLKGNRYYMANSFEECYANVIDEFEKVKQYKTNKEVKNG